MNGFIQSTLSLAGLFVPFVLWGLPAVMNKYHYLFMADRYAGLFRFSLKWFLSSLLVFSVIYWTFLPWILQFVNKGEDFLSVMNANKQYLFLIICAIGIRYLFTSFANVNKNSVVPNLLNNLLFNKIVVPAVVLAAGFYALSYQKALNLLLIASLVVIVIFFLITYSRKWLNFSKRSDYSKTETTKELIKFSSFSILNQSGYLLAFSIDLILVNQFLGDEAAGIYAIFIYLANVIRLPIDSLGAIVAPMVATEFSNNRLDIIYDYYKRLSIGVFIAMLCLFLPLLVSLNDIIIILNKPQLGIGFYIFLFSALGLLFNGTSILSGTIIMQSKYYRFNLYFILILVVFNLSLTYWFVLYLFPEDYKVAGAACATGISLAIFNLLKVSFVYLKYKMYPYTKGHLYLITIALIYIATIQIIPFGNNPWLNLILKTSIMIFVIYPIYYFKISEDITSEINSRIAQLKAKF